MERHADVVIVGGGIIGLTTAYFLARDGARVVLLDRGDLGQESSWAGAGILPPGNPAAAQSPFDLLRARSVAGFADFSSELRQRTGIDNGYLRCGGLEFLGERPGVSPTCVESDEWRGAGILCEHCDDPRRLEPHLAPNLGAALHIPDLAQVRNPWHLRALIAACRSLGVHLHPQAHIWSLKRNGSKIQHIQIDQKEVAADHFLIAAGAWSDALLAPLGIKLGVVPVRGQIVLLHPNRPLLQCVLLCGPRYLVPRGDGRILIGSTEEHVGFDKSTTPEARDELLTLAYSLVPTLRDAPIEKSWAGLRPGSPDGFPFLGRAPGFDNLHVAAGHFRSGIQLSLGTAQAMKELLLGQPPSLSLDPFRLDRPV